MQEIHVAHFRRSWILEGFHVIQERVESTQKSSQELSDANKKLTEKQNDQTSQRISKSFDTGSPDQILQYFSREL